MPGTTAVPDIEIIVEDIGGGGGGPTPPPGGGDDGDGSGDDRNRRRKWSPSPKRYSTAIAIGIVSILMFFMALASAFIVLRRGSELWVTVHLPRILYIASNQASSFFYIFTGAHAVHLLGGVAALLFVSFRKFEKTKISLPAAAEITSYYWHFMDGLWIFLLALLYLGK